MIWCCCGCAEPQDIIRGRKMRATGACVGALIGLVAITPAAGYVNIGAAFLFGVIGSVVCCGVLEAMERWGSRYVDDTLDVFAVHGVGEWVCVCGGGGGWRAMGRSIAAGLHSYLGRVCCAQRC
jgi:ammonia channel protein AmtB